MNSTTVIAITGGIGSGKSVVSRILRTMGYSVYDCDENARRLMDTSPSIKLQLNDRICINAVSEDGVINRNLISQIVFNNPEKLIRLNSIVHRHVAEDLKHCIATSEQPIFFFETAILESEGLESLTNGVWFVMASDAVRINRVMHRNNLTIEQVQARMASQNVKPPYDSKIIVNDNREPILPQIISLLNILEMSKESDKDSMI